jgi:hypothetical protein
MLLANQLFDIKACFARSIVNHPRLKMGFCPRLEAEVYLTPLKEGEVADRFKTDVANASLSVGLSQAWQHKGSRQARDRLETGLAQTPACNKVEERCPQGQRRGL